MLTLFQWSSPLDHLLFCSIFKIKSKLFVNKNDVIISKIDACDWLIADFFTGEWFFIKTKVEVVSSSAERVGRVINC